VSAESDLEVALATGLRRYGADLPPTTPQIVALAGRNFRWDCGWGAPYKLLVEVQGGIYSKGRSAHSGASLERDYEKLNLAACAGFRTLMFGPKDCTERRLPATIETIRRALGQAQKEA